MSEKQGDTNGAAIKEFDSNVLIIGAGPAGLTAAYCLTRQNSSVIVIEKDPVYVGGISRTVKLDGYLFDIGGHRFFSKSREIVDLWNEILPDGFVDRPRLSRIFYRGRYYSYPLNAFEALRNLGIVESALCIASYAFAKLSPIKSPRTFHHWVRNNFGERLFSIFFKTYTEKVWGMSCDEISADWAAQRIRGLNLGTAIVNALTRTLKPGRKTARNEVIKTLIDSFSYPRKGPGMLWDACAVKIKERGGHVRMGRCCERLTFNRSTMIWTLEASTPEGMETYRARHVISSAPMREIIEKTVPTPSSLSNARSLKYRDFLLVALIVRKPDLFPDNWIYIHDPSVQVGRIQNFRSWSPELVPDPSMSCLGMEYFCFEGDGLWSSPDEDLAALAIREIAKIGLAEPKEIVGYCVVRQPKAYPVYDDHYREHVGAVRQDLEKNYPNLHLVGRNGMHKYNNQDHAMMTAILTVRNILAGKRIFNVWDVNEDVEYHESGGPGELDALKSERLVPVRAK